MKFGGFFAFSKLRGIVICDQCHQTFQSPYGKVRGKAECPFCRPRHIVIVKKGG